MKFAFLIMGNDAPSDRAAIAGGEAQIVGVRNLEEAGRAGGPPQGTELKSAVPGRRRRPKPAFLAF